jgi:hypothetical protein
MVEDKIATGSTQAEANMKSEQNYLEWHLKDPRIRRWMVQGRGGLRWGYDSNAPARFHGRSQLEKYMGEGKLDDQGLCGHCPAVLPQQEPSL